MQESNLTHSPVDRIAERAGIHGELVALAFIILGVLFIVFPEFPTWAIGLALVATGMWHLVLAMRAQVTANRRAQNGGDVKPAAVHEPGGR